MKSSHPGTWMAAFVSIFGRLMPIGCFATTRLTNVHFSLFLNPKIVAAIPLRKDALINPRMKRAVSRFCLSIKGFISYVGAAVTGMICLPVLRGTDFGAGAGVRPVSLAVSGGVSSACASGTIREPSWLAYTCVNSAPKKRI